jgi:hypothetical protein
MVAELLFNTNGDLEGRNGHLFVAEIDKSPGAARAGGPAPATAISAARVCNKPSQVLEANQIFVP